MFATHLLFTSPRLRFSTAQQDAILKWGKDLGAVNVPSAHALKKCKDRVEALIGHPTNRITTSGGDIFHLNDIGSAIAKVSIHSIHLHYWKHSLIYCRTIQI